jgi:hypothetical protein
VARRTKSAQAMQASKTLSSPDYTDDEIIAALRNTHGLVARAAVKLKCAPSTIYRRMKSSSVVAEVIREERESTLDLAEDKLIEQMNKGNVTALIFYLKTQGKARGYVERTEVVQIPGDVKQLLEALGIDDTAQMWTALKMSLQAVKEKREVMQ